MEQESYENISKTLLKTNSSVSSGKMFAKQCLKINNKAFASFHQKKMVFKLIDPAHRKAMSLQDSKLWDPSGKNRPMKEWVQVSFEHEKIWSEFAMCALVYVAKLNN
jgi:hypothetical protein